jgi:hypothetical protein
VLLLCVVCVCVCVCACACACACVDGWNGRCRDALKQGVSETDEIGQTRITREARGKRSARLIGAQSLPEGACVSLLGLQCRGDEAHKRITEAPKPRPVVAMRTDAHG